MFYVDSYKGMSNRLSDRVRLIMGDRFSFRTNVTMGSYISRKATALFGGNESDYIKSLVQKEMDSDRTMQGRAEAQAEEIQDPEEWRKRADQEIRSLRETLDQVLGIKAQVERVIKEGQKRG
jgi:hypothetical protein